MVNFELILPRGCDEFRVTIRNLLNFSIKILFFPFTIPVLLGLVIATERTRFSVEFGVVLKL